MATFTQEDRASLADGLRRLLGDFGTEADVRRTMETPDGYDSDLWRRLAEMGIVGLTIDEIFGGGGAGPVELERVMEETGAALLCGPLLSSGVLAAGLLQALDDEDAATRLLPSIADGKRVATAALTGDAGGWTPETVTVDAAETAGAWSLSGVASFVTHGQIADTLLVAARARGTIALFEVDPTADGVSVPPSHVRPHTQAGAHYFLANGGASAGGGAPAWDVVERALDMTRVALAGEQAGGARRVLDMTVDYAKARVQFGRPIGSFQAIKHMAADLLLETESATSAARHAAQALADGASDAGVAISLAAFTCADAFSAVAAASIQMHGGIAFTWAHPAHLLSAPRALDAQLFGAPAFYRERYLRQLGA